MFQVNRKDVGGKYIDSEGDFIVTLAKVEESLDPKGREVCKLTFKTDEGSSITDRFINQENVWFRVNQLVAATNHNVPDGTQVDFLGVKGSYGDFLRQMIGLSLVITTKFEEYESNGEKKKAVRLRAMKQLPTAADDAGEEEKPF
jgi:hypothetical protein